MRKLPATTIGLTLMAILAALCTSAAQAAVIVQFTFPIAHGAGVETGSGFDATTLASNVTATPVADTSGNIIIGTENPTPNYSTEPVLRVNPNGNSVSAAQAVANSKYFSFTITPDAGYELDLASLTFKAARGGTSTPRGWVVRTSADAFASDLAASDVATVRPTWTDYTVSLTGTQFQDVTAPLTFRFYVYSPAAGSTIEFDNITVNGEVVAVIPEPAAGIMIIAGMALLINRRFGRTPSALA